MDTNDTTAIDWDILSEIISEGKAVLFLGPGATINYGEKDRQNRFFLDLLKKHPSDIYSYQQEDGLFVFSKKEAVYDIATKARKFYKADYSSPMLEKLAQIPFHLIVLLSPDTALQVEMTRQRFAFNEDYYDTINEHNPDLPGMHTPPLFYHLFGIAHKTESLIVSHAEMYNYMRAFLGGTRLPQNIKTALNFQNAKNLVFLGIDFDKWYFQLMLNMLGVDANNYNSYASIQQGLTGLRTIWEKHFHINFVPHAINEFVDRLHEQFSNKELLRKAEAGQPFARIYKISNIIEFLKLALNGTDLDSFCISYFETVYDDFTPEQSKSTRINKLIDYIRKENQFEQLLVLMKEVNPVQYEKNAPYYD